MNRFCPQPYDADLPRAISIFVQPAWTEEAHRATPRPTASNDFAVINSIEQSWPNKTPVTSDGRLCGIARLSPRSIAVTRASAAELAAKADRQSGDDDHDPARRYSGRAVGKPARLALRRGDNQAAKKAMRRADPRASIQAAAEYAADPGDPPGEEHQQCGGKPDQKAELNELLRIWE